MTNSSRLLFFHKPLLMALFTCFQQALQIELKFVAWKKRFSGQKFLYSDFHFLTKDSPKLIKDILYLMVSVI